MVQKISGHDVRVMVGATALSAEAMVVFNGWLVGSRIRVRGPSTYERECMGGRARPLQITALWGGVRKIPSGGINLPLGEQASTA